MCCLLLADLFCLVFVCVYGLVCVICCDALLFVDLLCWLFVDCDI